MGALPSKETHEDPSSVFFSNCGNQVLLHIPLTPHYFASADSLAFRQLFHARNNQSALYSFDVLRLDPFLPGPDAQVFWEVQNEDWGKEVDEVDPSVHYFDADSVLPTASADRPLPSHMRRSIEDRDELYRVLVNDPTDGQLVASNAVMCEFFAHEQRWKAARDVLRRHRWYQKRRELAAEQRRRGKEREALVGNAAAMSSQTNGSNAKQTAGASSRTEGGKEKGEASTNTTQLVAASASTASPGAPTLDGPTVEDIGPEPSEDEVATARAVDPPSVFLRPLAEAIAVRLTSDEEEDLREEYLRRMGLLREPLTSTSASGLSRGGDERVRHHHQQDAHQLEGGKKGEGHRLNGNDSSSSSRASSRSSRSRSGRARGERMGGGGGGSSSKANAAGGSRSVGDAGRNTTSVKRSTKRRAKASHSVSRSSSGSSSSSSSGLLHLDSDSPSSGSSFMGDDEDTATITRRRYRFEEDESLKDGRVHVVEEDGVLYHFAYNPFYSGRASNTATGRALSPSPAAAEALPSSSNPPGPHSRLGSGDLSPGDRFTTEPCRHAVLCSAVETPEGKAGRCALCGTYVVQRLAEKAVVTLPSARIPPLLESGATASQPEAMAMTNEEFLIPISAVRVVGVHGPLPAATRGTRWLRGVDDSEEDDYVEQELTHRPPVLRLCRFIEGSVGEKFLNRAALVSILTYRNVCRRAGLPDTLARPLWSTCVLSNIPHVQMVRETFFRAKAAVAEVDDHDLLLRHWLEQVDRENNFVNFINANLGIFKNYSPPERLVREHHHHRSQSGKHRSKTESGSRSASAGAAATVAAGKGEKGKKSSTRTGPGGAVVGAAGPTDDLSPRREEVGTIGRPEGHGARDTVEDSEDEAAAVPAPEVPQKPNFKLFSSRLEPHVPVSLYTLFDHDVSKDDTLPAGALPSYVQQELLHENTQRKAQPQAQRRPSHALYECGMMESTRGREMLFCLREDCVFALCYYCSQASAPIFIGAYIEPVDTTTVSYGGAIKTCDLLPFSAEQAAREVGRGQQPPPETSAIAPLPSTDHPHPHHQGVITTTVAAAHARGAQDAYMRLERPEDTAIVAEYMAKGLITAFNISDVHGFVCGPDAAHRLRKLVLPGPTDESSALARQQAAERQQYGHVFTYPAGEFRDGDLVIYNCDLLMWEHYEHVQLRRRFRVQSDRLAAAARGEDVPPENPEEAAMLARLLCVGLDELLLSWTKWVVDNRFYEDRNDHGWLRDGISTHGLIQLGRYYIWSFRHKNQRYFYGVIPKFAKDRIRRQKLMERQRRKKAAAAAAAAAAVAAATGSTGASLGSAKAVSQSQSHPSQSGAGSPNTTTDGGSLAPPSGSPLKGAKKVKASAAAAVKKGGGEAEQEGEEEERKPAGRRTVASSSPLLQSETSQTGASPNSTTNSSRGRAAAPTSKAARAVKQPADAGTAASSLSQQDGVPAAAASSPATASSASSPNQQPAKKKKKDRKAPSSATSTPLEAGGGGEVETVQKEGKSAGTAAVTTIATTAAAVPANTTKKGKKAAEAKGSRQTAAADVQPITESTKTEEGSAAGPRDTQRQQVSVPSSSALAATDVPPSHRHPALDEAERPPLRTAGGSAAAEFHSPSSSAEPTASAEKPRKKPRRSSGSAGPTQPIPVSVLPGSAGYVAVRGSRSQERPRSTVEVSDDTEKDASEDGLDRLRQRLAARRPPPLFMDPVAGQSSPPVPQSKAQPAAPPIAATASYTAQSQSQQQSPPQQQQQSSHPHNSMYPSSGGGDSGGHVVQPSPYHTQTTATMGVRGGMGVNAATAAAVVSGAGGRHMEPPVLLHPPTADYTGPNVVISEGKSRKAVLVVGAGTSLPVHSPDTAMASASSTPRGAEAGSGYGYMARGYHRTGTPNERSAPAAAAGSGAGAPYAMPDTMGSPPSSSLTAPPPTLAPPASGVSSTYYRSSGNNTFIQDNKRYENEYYPPLPVHRPPLAPSSRHAGMQPGQQQQQQPRTLARFVHPSSGPGQQVASAGPGSARANLSTSSFPHTPVNTSMLADPLLTGSPYPPSLGRSPTSRLPPNLEQDGSKTKGEALLASEDDASVLEMRKAFRWNPYSRRPSSSSHQ